MQKIRKAFVMQLASGCEQQYRERHDALWPELKAELKKANVSNYAIFLHPATLQLFAYAEITDETAWQAIAKTEACQRWWRYMRDIMDTNADNSPKAVDLTEVFFLP